MPTILLITEQERLRLLFSTIEREGLIRLRVAPTLGQGEEEIALRLPHFVFVENGISGLTGAVIASHLRTLLPEGSEVILMARDAADTTERNDGGLFNLDLSENDETLQRSVSVIIGRYAAPPQPLAPEAPPVPHRTAREVLTHQPDQLGPASRDKRLLWLVPLAVGVIVLGVFAIRGRKQVLPAAPPPQAATVALRAEGAGTGKGTPPSLSTPAALPSPSVQPAGQGPAPSRRATAPAPHAYVVQPGDTILRVLVKKYGLTRLEAVAIIPELKRLNNLSDIDIIQPGQTILLPAQLKAVR